MDTTGSPLTGSMAAQGITSMMPGEVSPASRVLQCEYREQYLRARYYCVVTATFLTEDSYLGSLTEPLTFNRYNYCVSSYLNYTDPSGNSVEINIPLAKIEQ